MKNSNSRIIWSPPFRTFKFRTWIETQHTHVRKPASRVWYPITNIMETAKVNKKNPAAKPQDPFMKSNENCVPAPSMCSRATCVGSTPLSE